MNTGKTANKRRGGGNAHVPPSFPPPFRVHMRPPTLIDRLTSTRHHGHTALKQTSWTVPQPLRLLFLVLQPPLGTLEKIGAPPKSRTLQETIPQVQLEHGLMVFLYGLINPVVPRLLDLLQVLLQQLQVLDMMLHHLLLLQLVVVEELEQLHL